MITGPVSEKHKKELFQHHEICFREHIEKIWGWDHEWQKEHFDTEWNNGEWRVLLDENAGNKVIGYLMWKIKEDHLYLCNLSLLPEHRNQGFGKEAINFIVTLANSRDLDVKLSVFRTNDRAKAFYERLGFKAEKQGENSTIYHRSRAQTT